jgi:hypothetical protein
MEKVMPGSTAQKLGLRSDYIEVSQQVGSGVRNNESRTTIKTNPRQKIDQDRRCERSLGVNPLGSHGNAFVE